MIEKESPCAINTGAVKTANNLIHTIAKNSVYVNSFLTLPTKGEEVKAEVGEDRCRPTPPADSSSPFKALQKNYRYSQGQVPGTTYQEAQALVRGRARLLMNTRALSVVHLKASSLKTGERAPLSAIDGKRELAGQRKDQANEGLHEATTSNYHLPQVWAEYLNKFNPWSWYGHFTFKDYPHPERAVKAWDLWIHKLNREIFGCKYYKHPEKGVTWARGTETQGRGSIHFHAILGRIPEDVRRLSWVDKWYEMEGISRIYAYQADAGAEYYMSKSTYAWKRGEVDLGGPLPQMSFTL